MTGFSIRARPIEGFDGLTERGNVGIADTATKVFRPQGSGGRRRRTQAPGSQATAWKDLDCRSRRRVGARSDAIEGGTLVTCYPFYFVRCGAAAFIARALPEALLW
jgi:hypothetical protein